MVILTLASDQVIECARGRFAELYNSLDDHEKLMFAELEQDAECALNKSKPLLGIFKRRGQYHFVILRQDRRSAREFEKSHYFISSLVLDKEQPITYETLQKLLRLLEMKVGTRINGIDKHPASVRFIDYEYFEYHIDLEAA